MNDQDMAQNEQVETENNLDTTPVAEQEQVGEVESTEEASSQETTETTEKKGYQARIQELNSKAKAAEEKAQSLEQKLAELTNPVGFQGNIPQFSPQEPVVAEGEEISVAELNRRIAQRDARLLQQANASTQLQLKQSEAINRINREANEVMGIFPELNPDSDEYNHELSETVSEATEAYIKSNPYSASVKTFVSKLMKPYRGAVTREVGKATENIAKQVSQAALGPTSVRKAEKTAAEKSIAELEAELGIVYS